MTLFSNRILSIEMVRFYFIRNILLLRNTIISFTLYKLYAISWNPDLGLKNQPE